MTPTSRQHLLYQCCRAHLHDISEVHGGVLDWVVRGETYSAETLIESPVNSTLALATPTAAIRKGSLPETAIEEASHCSHTIGSLHASAFSRTCLTACALSSLQMSTHSLPTTTMIPLVLLMVTFRGWELNVITSPQSSTPTLPSTMLF